MQNKRPRPVFLDLTKIRLPLTAVASIGHRISGVLLFLAIPFLIYFLDLSLRGPSGFAYVIRLLDGWPLRLLSVLLIWALAHHLFAGIRHLLLDIACGVSRESARRSAWMVNAGGLVVLLVAAGALLL